MGKKELPGTELLRANKADTKLKQQENKMKSKIDWKIIGTVTITLVTIGALVASFLAGMSYKTTQYEQIKAEAASIVRNVKVEVSKQ